MCNTCGCKDAESFEAIEMFDQNKDDFIGEIDLEGFSPDNFEVAQDDLFRYIHDSKRGGRTKMAMVAIYLQGRDNLAKMMGAESFESEGVIEAVQQNLNDKDFVNYAYKVLIGGDAKTFEEKSMAIAETMNQNANNEDFTSFVEDLLFKDAESFEADSDKWISSMRVSMEELEKWLPSLRVSLEEAEKWADSMRVSMEELEKESFDAESDMDKVKHQHYKDMIALLESKNDLSEMDKVKLQHYKDMVKMNAETFGAETFYAEEPVMWDEWVGEQCDNCKKGPMLEVVEIDKESGEENYAEKCKSCGYQTPFYAESFEAQTKLTDYTRGKDWEGKPYTGQIFPDHPDLDPELADRNQDGKMASWERAIGNQVAKGKSRFQAPRKMTKTTTKFTQRKPITAASSLLPYAIAVGALATILGLRGKE